MEETNNKQGVRERIRKEIHTRTTFAYEQGLQWYATMQHSVRSGNVFTCRAALKYQQARRIYIHYCNEFQRKQLLPFSK